MDAPQIDTADLARLNETDKAELRNFIEMENQRTKHQRSTYALAFPPSPPRCTQSNMEGLFLQWRTA